VDLIPLLAVMNTQASLDRLVDFLRNDNPVVEHAAAEALADYRWPNAAPQLWLLTQSSIPYLRAAANSGLEMCATNQEADLINKKILDNKTHGEELNELSLLLIQVSPHLAGAVLKAPETPANVRAIFVI